jgi:hypothetical protein
MTKEEIVSMLPGSNLDRLVCEVDPDVTFKPSTDMNDAWELRDTFHEENGGNITIEKFCDEFPEHCEIEYFGQKVQVWAKTTPEAICKAIKLWNEGHRGDCHPWTLFPEQMKQWHEERGLPLPADVARR